MNDLGISFTEGELAQVQKSVNNSCISQVIANKTKKVQAKIEENRSKAKITVHDTPEGEADQIFDTIASKYKGKVIYVDFGQPDVVLIITFVL